MARLAGELCRKGGWARGQTVQGSCCTRVAESCCVNGTGYHGLLFESSDFCLGARSYRLGSRGGRRCGVVADPNGEKGGSRGDCDSLDVRKGEACSRGGGRPSHHLHPNQV